MVEHYQRRNGPKLWVLREGVPEKNTLSFGHCPNGGGGGKLILTFFNSYFYPKSTHSGIFMQKDNNSVAAASRTLTWLGLATKYVTRKDNY